MENTTESVPVNETKPWERDELDGLLKGLTYPFRPDGRVDWKKMIPTEFIVINAERTQETDIAKVAEKDLLVLLMGFRTIASIRGFSNVQHDIVPTASQTFVAVKTSITWEPNFETGMKPVTFSACADAHLDNTKSFAQQYLTSIAENRGFVRAVRGFLNIPILGSDEVSCSIRAAGMPAASSEAQQALTEVLRSNKIQFDSFRNKMMREGINAAADWQGVADVPPDMIMDLITKVKKALMDRAAKKAANQASAG